MIFPCVKSANTKIQIHKYTNTQIHKYSILQSARKMFCSKRSFRLWDISVLMSSITSCFISAFIFEIIFSSFSRASESYSSMFCVPSLNSTLRSILMSSTMLCLIPKNLFSNELTFSFSETVALRSKMGLVSPSICKLEWIFKMTEQKKGDRNVLWAVSCHSSFLWQLQRGNREAGGSVFVCLFSIFDWTILAPKNNNTWNWYGTNVTLYSGVFPGGILLSVRCHFFLNFDGWLWPLFAFQHSFQLVALLNHVCGTRKK